jgi:very-short-patch-repair endonuclease
MKKLHQGANPELFRFARQNRKKSTEAEGMLWAELRNRQLRGFKFRRQHPVANYIADFYCMECNLVVEIDGDYHQSSEQKFYDEARTSRLGALGITVIRFTNDEVIKSIEKVLGEITSSLLLLQEKGEVPSPGGEDG